MGKEFLGIINKFLDHHSLLSSIDNFLAKQLSPHEHPLSIGGEEEKHSPDQHHRNQKIMQTYHGKAATDKKPDDIDIRTKFEALFNAPENVWDKYPEGLTQLLSAIDATYSGKQRRLPPNWENVIGQAYNRYHAPKTKERQKPTHAKEPKLEIGTGTVFTDVPANIHELRNTDKGVVFFTNYANSKKYPKEWNITPERQKSISRLASKLAEGKNWTAEELDRARNNANKYWARVFGGKKRGRPRIGSTEYEILGKRARGIPGKPETYKRHKEGISGIRKTERFQVVDSF